MPESARPRDAGGAGGVDPIGDSRDANAHALLTRLDWTVLRRLDGVLQGDYRTLLRGVGLDLADLREYQHHDDVRHIDWNVTARLQQPYVRQFTEDRELSAWFLCDLSASVDFGSGAKNKRQIAREFVGVLARLLTRHGNRVGALLYGNAVDAVLPARGGRAHVLELLQLMAKRPAESAAGVTHLRELLLGGQRMIKRRSSIFVVSDFISEPGWEAALGQLAMHHDVTAVRLFDPLEVALPDVGLLTMRDAESGEQIVVDTHDRGFRKRFQAAAEKREAVLRTSLANAGVDTLELATDDDLFDAIMRFAELRKQRSRLASWSGPRGGTRGPLSRAQTNDEPWAQPSTSNMPRAERVGRAIGGDKRSPAHPPAAFTAHVPTHRSDREAAADRAQSQAAP